MRRYEIYILALVLLGSNVWLAHTLRSDPVVKNLHIIDDLYQVDGIRFAIVRENREMGRACRWVDIDGLGSEDGFAVVDVDKPGIVIDLRKKGR